MGWIKFSSEEEGGVSSGVRYSVQINEEGFVSGLAWARDEYGWLSLNAAGLEGCPSGPCEARFDSETNEVSGWARFYTPVVRAGRSSWDGWVHLRGSAQVAESKSSLSKLASLLKNSPFSFFASFFASLLK